MIATALMLLGLLPVYGELHPRATLPSHVLRRILEQRDATASPRDAYFDRVSALLHFDGLNGATAVDDAKGNAWARDGSPTISTGFARFGVSSSYFDGNGDSWTLNNSAGHLIQYQDEYTIECFVLVQGSGINDNGSGVYGQCSNVASGEQGLAVNVNGTIRFFRSAGVNGGSDQSLTTAPVAPVGQWFHLAESYDGGTIRVFVDGVQVLAVTSARGWNLPAQPFRIGRVYVPGYPAFSRHMHGYIDEFRITKSVARYTGNFVPPQAAFPEK